MLGELPCPLDISLVGADWVVLLMDLVSYLTEQVPESVTFSSLCVVKLGHIFFSLLDVSHRGML